VTPDVWYKATNGTPNLLFVSQPGGGYREEARRWGVDDRRWSYAAQFLDVDEDGKLDLYVVNDFGEKALYMRRGDRFVDEAAERGVLDTGNGMGVSFVDYNNDGRLDLFFANGAELPSLRKTGPKFWNRLYRNDGNLKFTDVTETAGLAGEGYGFGAAAADFDGDGFVCGSDLGLLLVSWGTPAADLTGDGTTDGADLGAMLTDWLSR